MSSPEALVGGVTQLEKVINLDYLRPFQLQLSAAIGFSLEFFQKHQRYLLALRRAKREEEKDLIGRVCALLKKMLHLVESKTCNFLSFSAIVSEIVTSLAEVENATAALSSTASSTVPSSTVSASLSVFHLKQMTLLPKRDDQFVPLGDSVEQLMHAFGHFKKATSVEMTTLNKNVVVLTGSSGFGKSSLACEFSHQSLMMKKYDFVRWMPMSSVSAYTEWLAFADILHLQVQPDLPLESLIVYIFRRIKKCTYLLVLDGVDSTDIWNNISGILNPNANTTLLPVNNQHILMTSSLQYKWNEVKTSVTVQLTPVPLSASQRKRVNDGCYIPHEIHVRGFTWAATLAYFQKGNCGRSDNLLDAPDTTNDDTLAIHDTLSGYPLGIAYFFNFYSLHKLAQPDLKLSNFFELFQSKLAEIPTGQSSNPSARNVCIMQVLWLLLKENAAEVLNEEDNAIFIEILTLISTISRGGRMSKYLFKTYVSHSSNSENSYVAALKFIVDANILSEDNEEYICHPLFQRVLLRFLLNVDYEIDDDKIIHECSDGVPQFFAATEYQSEMGNMVSRVTSLMSKLISIYGDVLDAVFSSMTCRDTYLECFLDLQQHMPHICILRGIVSFMARDLGVIGAEKSLFNSFMKMYFTLSLLKLQLLICQKHYQHALVVCHEFLQMKNPVFESENFIYFKLKYCFAMASAGNGDYSQALAVFQELLECSKSISLNIKWIVRLTMQIGSIQLVKRYDRVSLATFQSALDIVKETSDFVPKDLSLGYNHMVSLLLLQIASLHIIFDQAPQALALCDEVDASPSSLLSLEALRCSALAHAKQSDHVTSLACLEEAFHVANAVFGDHPSHTAVARLLLDKGAVQIEQREYTKAIGSFENCLHIQEMCICAEHSKEVGTTLTCIGNALLAQGEHQAACDRFCEALEQYQDIESESLTNTLTHLARVYAAQGKFSDALTQYKIILGLHSRILPTSHPTTARTLKDMGHTYESLGRYKEALGKYNSALFMERKCYESDDIHADIAQTLQCMGQIYCLEEEYDNALMYFEKALVIKRLIYGYDHAEIIGILNLMGNLQKYRGQYDVALNLHKEVLDLKKKAHGGDSPSVQTTVEIIGKIQRIELIKQEAEKDLTMYIDSRSHEASMMHIDGIGFSKDDKVNGAYFLLQLIKESGLERFNQLHKVVGYSKHIGACENGRLNKIVKKIQMDAFTNFK